MTKRCRAPGQWQVWHRRYEWAARAIAFDRRLDAAGQAARERLAAERAIELARRQARQERREERLVTALFARALGALRDDKLTVNADAAIRAAVAICKMGRLNASMPADVEPEEPQKPEDAVKRTVIRIRPVVVRPRASA